MSIDISKFSIKLKKLVIGCSLESLIYSYYTGTPFLYCHKDIPHQFDFLEQENDLNRFLIKFKKTQLWFGEKYKFSKPPKNMIWDRLFFVLNLQGLSLSPGECASINITENTIKAYTSTGRMMKFEFDELLIFDDKEVFGIPEPAKNTQNIYKIYDWFNVNSCSKHNLNYIETEEQFIKEIIFYTSIRSAVLIPSRKDIVAISYVNENDLYTYEWSDVAAKFKILHLMKENGIKGPKNGQDINKPERTIRHAIKISSTKRDIVLMTKPNIYEDMNNIKFNNSSYSELLTQFENIDSPLKDSLERLNAI